MIKREGTDADLHDNPSEMNVEAIGRARVVLLTTSAAVSALSLRQDMRAGSLFGHRS